MIVKVSEFMSTEVIFCSQ